MRFTLLFVFACSDLNRFDTPVPLVPVTSPKVTSVSVPTPSAASGPGITGRRMSIIMLEEGGDDGEDEDGEASNGEEDDD